MKFGVKMLFKSWGFSYFVGIFDKDFLFFYVYYRFSVKLIIDEYVYVFNVYVEVCLESDDCFIKIFIMKNIKLFIFILVIIGSNKSRLIFLNFFVKYE